MKIQHLNGTQFKRMVLVGAQHVIASQEELNQMNVFPVPDGDTGSNMAALFLSITHDLEHSHHTELHHVIHEIAEAALNGSRGNSGAIIAQFFQGMQEALNEQDQMGTEKFAEMAVTASKQAREAISEPVEGTIITVMHDWATWIHKNWHDAHDFNTLLKSSLDAAQDSLGHTPELLEVLSKNHVVDAGAQGFVHFLEGLLLGISENYTITTDSASQEGIGEELDHQQYVSSNVHLDPHATHTGNLNHQYCTECIIHGSQLNTKKIKEALKDWGDSFVIVGGKNKVKIHIHTNAPHHVFKAANMFGELLETKADDMWAQYRARTQFQLNKQIVLVTDTTCNLPQEFFVQYNIIILPLQIIIDDKSYLDRINLSSEEFLNKLKNPKTRLLTSQPSPADIKNTLNKALNQASTVIGIFVSEKLSGTYQSVVQAAKRMHEEEELQLFDSRNVSGGLGLIVLEAAKAIQAHKSLPTIKKIIQDSIAHTATFVSFTTLKYAIRGGRIKKSTGTIAGIFKILPILRIDAEGIAKKVGFSFGKKTNRRKTLKKAIQYAKNFQQVSFIIAHAGAKKEAEFFAKTLEKRFPQTNIPVVETTPIVVAQAGPATIAISVLGQ